MNIEIKDIEQYLSEVKKAVENGRYRLDRNSKRQDNIKLFLNYVMDEAKAKEIILSLTARDFSEILQNEHQGYEHERLYVFGKDVILLERHGTEKKDGGSRYDTEKKGFLRELQKGDRIPFTETEYQKEYKGQGIYIYNYRGCLCGMR